MHTAVEKSIHKFFLERNGGIVNTSTDDRLKWMPYATVFLMDLFKVHTRSSWKKQVLIVGATEAIRYLIADNLKKLTDEHRPFPYTGHNSFPSGHTSSSFAGAEFLHKELRDSIPVLSCAGYLAATGAAFIRLRKNRHWLRDVIAGAAIGIASAKLAYFIFNKVSKAKKPVKMYEVDPEDRVEIIQDVLEQKEYEK